MALFVYTKRLCRNSCCDVSAPGEPGRLCTPVHNRVHRRRPHIGRFGRRRLPGLARSRAQTVRFGVASASHRGDQVTGRQGGYRAERRALYVTVRDRARGPFTPLSRLPGSGRPRHEPAICQWICQWETWEIRDAGARRRDIVEISAGQEACEAELISTDQKAGGSEGWGFESLRARQLSPGAMRNSAPSV